jgi:hypothetical protein
MNMTTRTTASSLDTLAGGPTQLTEDEIGSVGGGLWPLVIIAVALILTCQARQQQ